MHDIYKNIKRLRKMLGMTQSELAEKVGYKGKDMISRIEAGQVDLKRERVIDFANALNVSPNELMGWQEFDENSVLLNLLGNESQEFKNLIIEFIDLYHNATDDEKAKVVKVLKVFTDILK